MVNKKQGLSIMKNVVKRYISAEQSPQLLKIPPSEQDLKTKFVVPMLQALNWDIYNFGQVRKQKNFHGFLPDFTLSDQHGKIILVEVKPPSTYRELENDLSKYRDNSDVRNEALVLLLTTFGNSEICVLGKEKGMRRLKLSYSHYIPEFDKLWTYLSNSEEGFKARTYEKALAPREKD